MKKTKTDYNKVLPKIELETDIFHIVDALVVEFTEKISENNLNYRQAKILIEVLQAEIEECKLAY